MSSQDHSFRPSHDADRQKEEREEEDLDVVAPGRLTLTRFLTRQHGPGSRLPASIASTLGPRLGDPLDDVRVYDDARTSTFVRSLGASAFTYGRRIYAGPNTSDDTLAHEAAHAAQHRGAHPTGPVEVGGESHSEDFADRAAASRYTPFDVAVPVAAPRVRFKDTGGVDVVGVLAKEMGTDEGKAKQMLRNANAEGRSSVEQAVRKNFDAEKAKKIIEECPPGGGTPTPEVKGKDQAQGKDGEGGKEKGKDKGKEEPKKGGGDAHGKGKGEGGGEAPAEHPKEAGTAEKVGEFQGTPTSDLSLIHQELIEHEEWKSASAHVGTAGSADRAAFIAESAGKGAVTGFATGAALGAATGLVTKLAERFVPIPGVGAIIAGGMSAYGLATKDWKEAGETIGKFGQGASTYEVLANTIASVSEVIDILVNVFNVLAGIIGLISAVMWIITICTLGAASPLAATLSTIALAIVAATSAVDEFNKLILQPLVMLFRAMHTFTTEADPRDVEKQGKGISTAAEGAASIFGAKAGAAVGEGLGGIGEKGGGHGGGGHDGGDPGSGHGKGDPHADPHADPHGSSAKGGEAPEGGGAHPEAKPEVKPEAKPEAKPTEGEGHGGKAADDPAAKKGGGTEDEGHGAKPEKPTEGEGHGKKPEGEEGHGPKPEEEGHGKKKGEGEEGEGGKKKTRAEKKAEAKKKMEEALEARKQAKEEMAKKHDENKALKKKIETDRPGEVEKAAREARRAEDKKIETERQAKHQEAEDALKAKQKAIDEQAKTDNESVRKAEADKEAAARQAAHEERLADIKAAGEKERLDIKEASDRSQRGMEDAKTKFDAAKESPELEAKAKAVEEAHKRANEILDKIEDPGLKAEAKLAEAQRTQAEMAEIDAQRKATWDKASKDFDAEMGAAKKQMDADIKAAQAEREATWKRGAEEHDAKVKAAEDARTKAMDEQAQKVKDQHDEAKGDADKAKTEADKEAKGKAPEADKAAADAAAKRNAELDKQWEKAKAEGKKKSDEYRHAAAEAEEAKKHAGKKVGEADFSGIRDTGNVGGQKRGVAGAISDKLYGKEYGQPEGPRISEEDDEKEKEKEEEREREEREGDEHADKDKEKAEDKGEKDKDKAQGKVDYEKELAKKEKAEKEAAEKKQAGGGEKEEETGYGEGKASRFQVVKNERVSPKYKDPPGSVEQLDALKAKIEDDLGVRAKAEQDELKMKLAEAKSKADAKQIAELEKKAKAGTEASKAHEEATKRKEEANKAQKERADQGKNTAANAGQRMAGVTALSVPLAAFEGFTWIGMKIGVSHFAKMNEDAKKFRQQLTALTTNWGQRKAEVDAQGAPIAKDAAALKATAQTGQQNTQKMGQNEQKVGDLKGKNDEKAGQAGAAKAEAQNVKGAREASAQKGKSEYQKLAGDLKTWAVGHRQARMDADGQQKENRDKPKDFGQDMLPAAAAHDGPPAAVEAAPVQRKASGGATSYGEDPSLVAKAGTTGSGGSLPYLDRIQRSFGRHDVSNVRSFQGGVTSHAARALGAEAYAFGDAVGFAGSPDLHTAAHEAAHVVQQRHGVQLKGGIDGGASDPYERHADTVADAVVRGESAEHLLNTSPAHDTSASVQRKTTVKPVTLATEGKLAILGDGTPANPGKAFPEFFQYIKRQADWFTNTDFTTGATAGADRAAVWKVAQLCNRGIHVTQALATFHVGELSKVSGGDAAKLESYIQAFDSSAYTIQLSSAAPTLARALQLGAALVDLAGFVPGPVLKIVIPEAGLIYLVDKGKLAELKKYYATFSPTLERPEEWDPITKLLDTGGVAKYAALAPWIHDLHIYTKNTLDRLLINVADKGRSKPVVLVLFSALDWNKAFLLGGEMETLVLNGKTLVLIVQGATSIANVTAEVTRIAADYGQLATSMDPLTKKSVSKGRLSQVVFAGHGSEHGVEMASPGTGAWVDEESNRVGYDQKDIDRNDPKKNGTELLMKTVIESMDPADVNIVFAGCLVNSHEIPGNTKVSSNAKAAQKNLQDAIKKHPNLAEYVKAQMAAMGAKGTVTASNASTQFDSFKVDKPTGKMGIDNKDDPDLGHSKLDYVRTGVDGEGVMRAVLEAFADAAVGPAKVTAEMRTRVTALGPEKDWFLSIIRVAFELSLPAAGDVNAAKVLDIAGRIRPWGELYWENTASPTQLARNTNKGEDAKLYAAMLASDVAAWDHIAVGANNAWLKFDATKGADMIKALDASSYTTKTLGPKLARKILDDHLGTMLPPSATPTKGQLVLGLTIAAQDGKGMPKAVHDFLRAAAGGKATSAFPAALKVGDVLKTAGEDQILEDIGLSATSPTVTGSGASATVSIDANVDTNADGTKDSFVNVNPYETKVTASVLNVRAKPGGAIIDTVKKGDIVRVIGRITGGTWTLVDHDGKVGYLFSTYLAQ